MIDRISNGLEFARERTGESYTWFLRTFLNRGYLEHIKAERDKAKTEPEEQLVDIVGRLVTKGLIIPSEMPDEWFLFRDQMYEFEQGRLNLDEDTADSKTLSDR